MVEASTVESQPPPMAMSRTWDWADLPPGHPDIARGRNNLGNAQPYVWAAFILSGDWR
jgi:hypothetical protein